MTLGLVAANFKEIWNAGETSPPNLTRASDGKTDYIVATASSALDLGDVVVVTPNGMAARVTKARVDGIHVAFGGTQTNMVAGQKAWFATEGDDIDTDTAAVGPGAKLYTSGTGGRLDDTANNQTPILGIIVTVDGSAAGVKKASWRNVVRG